jgi:hypothetical protein
MTRFVYRAGCWRDPHTNEPMELPLGDVICAPQVISDTPEYRSPIDGRLIDGRAARREDLKRNDCVEAGPPKKFDREEYVERKARQAKVLEQRKAGMR